MNSSSTIGQPTAFKTPATTPVETSVEVETLSDVNTHAAGDEEYGKLILTVMPASKNSEKTDVLPVSSRDPNGKIVLFDRETPLSYDLEVGMVVEVLIIERHPRFLIATPLKILRKRSNPDAVRVVVKVLEKEIDWDTAREIFESLKHYFES